MSLAPRCSWLFALLIAAACGSRGDPRLPWGFYLHRRGALGAPGARSPPRSGEQERSPDAGARGPRLPQVALRSRFWITGISRSTFVGLCLGFTSTARLTRTQHRNDLCCNQARFRHQTLSTSYVETAWIAVDLVERMRPMQHLA